MNTQKVLWTYQGKTLELPVEWDQLSFRQQDLLKARFPISGWYKVLAFIFPGIYLLYMRKYGLFFLALLLSLIPGVTLVVRILLVIYLEKVAYHKGSINMKNALVAEDYLWNEGSSEYRFDIPIQKNVKKGLWLRALLIIFPLVLLWILAVAFLPRLWNSQGLARDLARRAALRDLSAGLSVYSSLYGEYPVASTFSTKDLSVLVEEANLFKTLPLDPQKSSSLIFVGKTISNGDFWYYANDNSFILVSKVEKVENANATAKMLEGIPADLKILSSQLCDRVEIGNSDGDCNVKSSDDLRYVVIH